MSIDKSYIINDETLKEHIFIVILLCVSMVAKLLAHLSHNNEVPHF